MLDGSTSTRITGNGMELDCREVEAGKLEPLESYLDGSCTVFCGVVASINVKTVVLDHPPTLLISPGPCDALYEVLNPAALAMIDHQANPFGTIALDIRYHRD